jgi:hypothetical protein
MNVTPKMPRRGRGAAKGHRERTVLRQAAALRLRTAGASYRQIGEQLGTSAVQAWRDVGFALGEVVERRNEDAVALRTLELERLDRLTLALWPKAQKAHVDAVRALVRVSERRCRLLGLDATVAAKLELTGNPAVVAVAAPLHDHLDDDAFAQRLRQALDAFAPREPEPELPAQDPAEAAKAAYAAELAARGRTH